MLKEILEEIKLNEMKLKELPKINYKWNPNKEENNKMLIQFNKRLTYPHFTLDYVTKMLNNGIKEGLRKANNSKNDLCIKFAYSNFVLVYNRRDDYIRGVRIDPKVGCKSNTVVYETYEDKKRTQDDLMIKGFNEGEVILGLKLETEGFNIKVTNVCECVEVNY